MNTTQRSALRFSSLSLVAALTGVLLAVGASCGSNSSSIDAATPANLDASSPGTDAQAQGADAAAAPDAQTPGVDATASQPDAQTLVADASTTTPDGGAALAGEPGGPCQTGDTCGDPYWTCVDLTGLGKVCTQPCMRNSNCPDALRCEQFGATQADKYCVVGPRGLGDLGDPCGPEGNDGCKSAVCWDADESLLVSTCTGDCFGHFACPQTLPICWDSIAMCGPVTAGNSGGLCLAQDACNQGTCIEVPNMGKRCATTCSGPAGAGNECIQDYLSCQDVGGQFYCLAAPK